MVRAALALVAGLVLVAASFLAADGLRSETVRDLFVENRVAACLAHADGPDDFNRDTLGRELHRFERNLGRALLALGLALAALGAAGLVPRWRGPLAAPGLAAIAAALGLGLAEACEQARLLVRGARDGLFTEDRDAHLARFFDRAVPAARAVAEQVPDGGSFLYIDFGDRMIVYKAGYLLFPRRMFHLPHEIHRLDAATFRSLAARDPDGVRRLLERGITHAVDWKELVATGDPSAVIPLEVPP